MDKINKLSPERVRSIFLQHDSYCEFPLPSYFDFSPLLEAVHSSLSTMQSGIKDSGGRNATNHDNVSYTIQSRKEGHYSWRPFELIHPALYVDLVNEITKEDSWATLIARIEQFSKNENINCVSMPKLLSRRDQRVSAWWKDVEQLSIVKALDFKYLFTTDIAAFYPSIYTHSISWSIHGKEEAKKFRRQRNCQEIGHLIDTSIQSMRYGQTNGIPQGSLLMDFIAELVLGYADLELTQKLEDKVTDYPEFKS